MTVFGWLHETFSLPAVLACFGALLSATGAIWASYEQNNAQKTAESQTAEIRQLNGRILSLTEENKALAKEGIASVTGGNGFVYVDILKGYFPNAFAPSITSVGEYPQYDLSIRFFDEQKPHEIQIIRPLVLNIATLPPAQTAFHQVPAFEINSQSDYAKHNIFISARNGSFIEEMRLRKVDGEWYSALRVYRSKTDGTKILLLEQAMPKYPRLADQTLAW